MRPLSVNLIYRPGIKFVRIEEKDVSRDEKGVPNISHYPTVILGVDYPFFLRDGSLEFSVNLGIRINRSTLYSPSHKIIDPSDHEFALGFVSERLYELLGPTCCYEAKPEGYLDRNFFVDVLIGSEDWDPILRDLREVFPIR